MRALRFTWLLASLAAAMPATVAAQGAALDAGQPLAPDPAVQELSEQHRPRLSVRLEPKAGIATGDTATLTIEANALQGDHVTLPDQGFEPLELIDKRAVTRPPKGGRQTFVFELTLLALQPGKLELPGTSLRVVTADNIVGEISTEAHGLEVKSLLANEPDAKPKPPSAPVRVMQDDLTLLYLGGGLLAALLLVALTLLLSRWWRRREKKLPPPPPPRPPWEVAVEKLAQLRRRKQSMVEEGHGVEFVDEVSDVVREYLGGRFGFDGLETTTDEMLKELKGHHANGELIGEVQGYLHRCDLVKFAKVMPDQDEADLIFAKAQEIVQFSRPTNIDLSDPAPPHALQEKP